MTEEHGISYINKSGNLEWLDPDKISAQIAQLKAERDEWKADAERFIQLANFNNKKAGEYLERYKNYLFELHEQLVAKYGGEK